MKKGLAVLLLVVLAAGGWWLTVSIRAGLNAGADCDVYRQWTVSQYVHRGINPYSVATNVLFQAFGTTHGPDRARLQDLVIYEVHTAFVTNDVPGFLPAFGAPTPTYPPSSLLPLCDTIGRLPRKNIWSMWMGFNLLAVALLVVVLSRCFPLGLHWKRSVVFAVALSLLWFPLHEVLRVQQFIVVAFLFSIWGLAVQKRCPVLSGVLFSLALIKPSATLPFMMFPAARWKWEAGIVVVVLHSAATLFMSYRLQTPPLLLMKQWMEVPRYMLQGAYSIQEVLNNAGLDNTALGTVLTLGFVGVCFGWVVVCRKADWQTHLVFLTAVSVLWTYHERYDFVVLLWPLFYFLSAWKAGRRKGLAVAAIAALVLLNLAFPDFVYGSHAAVARIVRWIGRFSLVILFFVTAVELKMAARKRITEMNGET